MKTRLRPSLRPGSRWLLGLLPLALAACASAPKPETAAAQGDAVSCKRETQVGSMLPSTQCRTAMQRAADRAAVDEMNQALKKQAVQSPMPGGGK
ncbi:MAG: hypothetical protein GXC94_07205 [Comamonadaceae bacterium]|jgi:hypothetical protein|nr:hypothetical protein [Comamonadaceae bacterium]